jgi:hypothetical protein
METSSQAEWFRSSTATSLGQLPIIGGFTIEAGQHPYSRFDNTVVTASMIPRCGGVAGITGAFSGATGVGTDIADQIKEIDGHVMREATGGLIEIRLTIVGRTEHPGHGARLTLGVREVRLRSSATPSSDA